MTELSLNKKKPFMTARQVAIAAVFGGIAFAFEALGIKLPFLPGFSMNFGGLWLTLATLIAGPLAGIVVALMISIGGEVGLIGFPGYLVHVIVLALLYKSIFKIQKKPIQIVAFWAWNSVALFFQYWYWIFLYGFVFKVMSIPALIVYNFAGPPYIGFDLIYCLVPSILLLSAPQFLAPDWKWFPSRKDDRKIGQSI
ncbi:hypothetical protein ACFVSW_00515 [Neobacillus sp. NPDC058068]|uniref:hypothetical protein n=1 Tax=Neobacillus sp. NPDC058068 TaxID=3346325 RepID=UPI0036DB8F0D